MSNLFTAIFPLLVLLAAVFLWFLPELRARLNGVRGITVKQLEIALQGSDKPIVLDIRSASEFASGHIGGAVNVPMEQIDPGSSVLAALKASRVVCVCAVGKRSATASVWLAKAGFNDVHNLKGGMRGWGKRPVKRG